MSIWVVCEAQGGGFRSTTFELLSRARSLGAREVTAVTLGGNSEALKGCANRVVTITGASDVEAAAPAALEALLATGAPGIVLFGESTRTRDILPRLAARTGGLAFTNCVGLDRDGDGYLVTRPVYGGKAYASYSTGSRTGFCAFRANSFASDAPAVADTAFQEFAAPATASRVTVVEAKPRVAARVDLLEARRVVSAGRGLKAPENLKVVEELADALGGAVGVSRAIVDAGWADHSIQVGKSGKTVAPALYIAAGISGAVHHTMGMDTSKVVVAVNLDPKAPIFNYADYGIVGDALAVLPAMTAELRKAAG